MKLLPTFGEMQRVFETLKKYRNEDGYVMRNREVVRLEASLERDESSGNPLFHSIIDGLEECGCIKIHKVLGQRERTAWSIFQVLKEDFTEEMYNNLTSSASPLERAKLRIKELETENARLKAQAIPSEKNPEN